MMNRLIKAILILLFTLNTVQAELLSSYTLDRTTKIHTIQGSGSASAERGKTHTIEGIVVGYFQAKTQLKGFFLQEEDADIDDDPTTSEGLFVYNPNGTDVNVGDIVRVTGEVYEYRSLTELKNISKLTVCSHSASVTPATLSQWFKCCRTS